MKNKPNVSIVIPLYNEELIFPQLIERLNSLISEGLLEIEFVLVDDGSEDKTSEMMRELAIKDAHYNCIFLTKNYGHQEAITAGMNYANGSEAVMLMDGDLQDPPELVFDFYQKIKEGYDVVYAVRKKRKEGFLLKLAYWLYYRIQRLLTKEKMPLDSGDFSMMSRRVVNLLNSFPEKTRYLRGLRSWVGFKQIGYEYERASRTAGETKYSLGYRFKFGFDGIISFSDIPLQLVTKLGMLTIFISFIYIAVLIYKKLVYNNVMEGFTTLFIGLALFSGVQLICLGLIGEYLGRVYKEVKNRPPYIVKDRVKDKTFFDA